MTGSAGYPVRRFSSPAATTRGSTREPGAALRDDDAEVRDAAGDADAEDLLGAGEPGRDGATAAAPRDSGRRRRAPGGRACSRVGAGPQTASASRRASCGTATRPQNGMRRTTRSRGEGRRRRRSRPPSSRSVDRASSAPGHDDLGRRRSRSSRPVPTSDSTAADPGARRRRPRRRASRRWLRVALGADEPERDARSGSASTSGWSAAATSTSPAPARVVRDGAPPDRDGRAVDAERRLDLVRRPVRMPLEQQRDGARDVGRRHARPRRRRPAAGLGREDRRARGHDVGLEPERDRRRAGGGEARDRRGAAPDVLAPTVIARAELPGDDNEPGPKSSKSFPAATTGTTPAAAAASSASATTSRDGSISGSPIERLMTSMPSVDRRLDRRDDLRGVAVEPDVGVGRDGQRLVVADVRARRDAADPRAARRACRGSRRRSPRRASRGSTARGRRAWRRARQVAPGGGNARATITFAVVYARLALREAGGHRVAGRVEERGAVWSTPSSMIPILIPAPAFGRSAAGSSRARIVTASGPASARYVDRREHLADAGKAGESRQVARREDDRDAVGDEPVAPVHRRARDAGSQRALEAALLVVDPPRGAGVACRGKRRRARRTTTWLRSAAAAVGARPDRAAEQREGCDER